MEKKFISNKDESVRMFQSDFMESFSHIHWSVPLWIYIPVISFSLFRAVYSYQLSFFAILGYFTIGLIIWSALEYCLHRFVFHYKPSSEFGKRLHFIFHGVHHDYPKDSRRLVMAPAISLPIAVIFYFIFYYAFGSVLMAPAMAGIVAGYLCYDMTHYAVHHYAFKNKIMLSIKAYHMKHHYVYDDKGYGVSQPFWDYIFRTTFPDKN